MVKQMQNEIVSPTTTFSRILRRWIASMTRLTAGKLAAMSLSAEVDPPIVSLWRSRLARASCACSRVPPATCMELLMLLCSA